MSKVGVEKKTEETVEEKVEPVVSLEALKKQRTSLRKDVRRWTSEITRTILANGSRRYLGVLIKKVETADDLAKKIIDSITDALPASSATEYERQMEYTEKVEDAKERVAQYLEARKDVAPSEAASEASQEPPASELLARRLRSPTANRPHSYRDIRDNRPEPGEDNSFTLLQRTARRGPDDLGRRLDVDDWVRRAEETRTKPDETPDD